MKHKQQGTMTLFLLHGDNSEVWTGVDLVKCLTVITT